MEAPLLEALGVSKAFGPVRALHRVDLRVFPGEVVALLGENGAGKSTLAKILAGALRSDSGELRLCGQPVSWQDPSVARRHGVVAVHQEPTLIDSFSVAENVVLGTEPVAGAAGWLRLLDPQEMVARTLAALSELGVNRGPGVRISDLSIAEQQLVEIARALSTRPRVLILDEATSRLMPSDVRRLFDIMKKLKAHGGAVVFISHRLQEVLDVSDRVCVLKDGRRSGEVRREQATRECLIRMMVGRSLPDVFPDKPRRSSPDPVLQLRGAAIRGRLDSVDLDLYPGEVLGVGGLEGHGQRELVRGLAGLSPFERGEVRVLGRAVRIRSPLDAVRHGIAYLPEDRRLEGLVMPLAVSENTVLPRVARQSMGLLSRRQEFLTASELLSQLAVRTPGLDAPIGALSGGNQQKVMFAKWLGMKPKVFLLHEPTRGVDIETRIEIYQLVRRAASEGTGVVLVTSDMVELLNMSSRIAVFYEGRVMDTLSDPDSFSEERVMRLAVGEAATA